MFYNEAMKMEASEETIKAFEESKVARVTDVEVSEEEVVIKLNTLDGEVILRTTDKLKEWNDHKEDLMKLKDKVLNPFTTTVPFDKKKKTAKGKVGSSCNGILPELF